MNPVRSYIDQSTSAAPLATFRIGLGLLLFAGIIRFWLKGWIEQLYVQPKYFFKFYGFEFVTSWGHYTYFLFAVCAIAAFFVALGYFYRASIITLFLSFTYIELIDKSTYLNHYYFISMVCLLMIFLPANACFSVDSYRNKHVSASRVPRWTIDSIKLLVCMLYFFAGLAKVNSDWLLHAQPLKTWLPAKNDIFLIGPMFNYPWAAFAFAWIGCLYDLFIPFFLINPRTRPFAFMAVIVFHVLTSILFPIGMFPYIMIFTATIFFSANTHEKFVDMMKRLLNIHFTENAKVLRSVPRVERTLLISIALFFFVQTILPFRYLLYPGELFWTEEGYRFSWRVMLMEKAGMAQFVVKDSSGKEAIVDNRDFLTPLQEKMMATQPDMILQYAHFLRDHFAAAGYQSPEVYVDSYVALNGRLGKPLIDPKVNLAAQQDSFQHKSWILPFEHDIKGL